jgi:hypothetical protein
LPKLSQVRAGLHVRRYPGHKKGKQKVLDWLLNHINQFQARSQQQGRSPTCCSGCLLAMHRDHMQPRCWDFDSEMHIEMWSLPLPRALGTWPRAIFAPLGSQLSVVLTIRTSLHGAAAGHSSKTPGKEALKMQANPKSSHLTRLGQAKGGSLTEAWNRLQKPSLGTHMSNSTQAASSWLHRLRWMRLTG